MSCCGRRIRAAAVFALVLATGLPASSATAADDRAGQRLAQACAVCHGILGISVQPDAPNLAGQPAIYLAAQLKAYRGSDRRHEVMNVIAKPLSDADIADLAAWFASIRIEAQAPR